MGGAVVAHAERSVLAREDADRAIAEEILLRLSSTDGSALRWDEGELVAVVSGPGAGEGAVRAVLGSLGRALLVRVDGGAVEIGHEALLASWPRLGSARLAQMDRLLLLERVREARIAWERADGHRDFLAHGSLLKDTRETASGARGFGPADRAFLQASRRRARFRNLGRGALCGFMALLLASGASASGCSTTPASTRPGPRPRRSSWSSSTSWPPRRAAARTPTPGPPSSPPRWCVARPTPCSPSISWPRRQTSRAPKSHGSIASRPPPSPGTIASSSQPPARAPSRSSTAAPRARRHRGRRPRRRPRRIRGRRALQAPHAPDPPPPRRAGGGARGLRLRHRLRHAIQQRRGQGLPPPRRRPPRARRRGAPPLHRPDARRRGRPGALACGTDHGVARWDPGRKKGRARVRHRQPLPGRRLRHLPRRRARGRGGRQGGDVLGRPAPGEPRLAPAPRARPRNSGAPPRSPHPRRAAPRAPRWRSSTIIHHRARPGPLVLPRRGEPRARARAAGTRAGSTSPSASPAGDTGTTSATAEGPRRTPRPRAIPAPLPAPVASPSPSLLPRTPPRSPIATSALTSPRGAGSSAATASSPAIW